MVPVQVQPGDVLAGKYRVERVLGKGNMGVVVAASHVDLAQRVALKFMLPGAAAQAEHRERFLREARASVRLRSQHVARVLDVGTLDGETPYIVMELLEGHDLAHALSKGGPLPFPAAVEYVLQACEAVAEAHAAGVVHRDLKPANLFLTHDVGGAPCVKVLDFGISKSTGVDLTLTQDAQALGSPLYMSPEQMNSSRDVDARSDIWALGIVLFQLVAGVTPFHADTIQSLCARVLMGAPTPLAELRPDAPAGFEAVVLRCIERDRSRRFQSVAELAAALAPYAPPSAAAYVQRVARVLGVASSASAPSATASGQSPSASVVSHPAGSSTIVMPQPAQAVTNSATGGLASPPLAASAAPLAPATSPIAGNSAGLTESNSSFGGNNPVLAGSNSGLSGSNSSFGGNNPALAGSGTALVTTQAPEAPSRGRGALIAAALGGALVVAAIAVALVRPWSTTAASPDTSTTAAAAMPTSTTPTVVPAATTLPTATVVPTAEATATATAATTATPTTTAAAKPTAPTKPAGRATSAPTSRPGVSYDDRR